jgi:hypothetical protein
MQRKFRHRLPSRSVRRKRRACGARSCLRAQVQSALGGGELSTANPTRDRNSKALACRTLDEDRPAQKIHRGRRLATKADARCHRFSRLTSNLNWRPRPSSFALPRCRGSGISREPNLKLPVSVGVPRVEGSSGRAALRGDTAWLTGPKAFARFGACWSDLSPLSRKKILVA